MAGMKVLSSREDLCLLLLGLLGPSSRLEGPQKIQTLIPREEWGMVCFAFHSFFLCTESFRCLRMFCITDLVEWLLCFWSLVAMKKTTLSLRFCTCIFSDLKDSGVLHFWHLFLNCSEIFLKKCTTFASFGFLGTYTRMRMDWHGPKGEFYAN